MLPPTDTIAAVATPPGVGGVGIVRISGPLAPAVAGAMAGGLPRPRFASLAEFTAADGDIIDTGLVLYFPAPRSFTGEDVVELHAHGGLFVLKPLLERTFELGCRPARPGEFSERAFINDKIDLVQAEAIADLVQSGSEAAARAAQRSLQGVFSAAVQNLQQALTQLRVFVEAAIDFPDEEIDFLAESDVHERLEALAEELRGLLKRAAQGRLLRDGIVLAIVGAPNAGKSSLLNALSGEERAIVTDIPGTTRDVLREHIDILGIPVHVADTAGIRETEDLIEAEGVRRALQAVEAADLVLLVEDASDPAAAPPSVSDRLPEGVRVLRVLNKIDLLSESERSRAGSQGNPLVVSVSARTGEGLDALRSGVRDAVGGATESGDGAGGSFSARQRHVDGLRRAGMHIDEAVSIMASSRAAELLAEELRLAQQCLGEITGEMAADDLLGEIFSSFCIGK